MDIFYNNLDNNYITFENHKITTIIDNNNNIWFNSNELTIAIGYKNPKDAIIKSVDNNNKIQLQYININYKIKKHPHSIYINEVGLYKLLIKSKLTKAKKFQDWIFETVLQVLENMENINLKKSMNNIHLN